MKKARKVLLSQIFDQLRMLRGTISTLETLHESEFFVLVDSRLWMWMLLCTWRSGSFKISLRKWKKP